MLTDISNRPTLFDYIANYEAGKNDLDAIVSNSNLNTSKVLDDVQTSLVSVNSIDTLVNQIQSGESKVSQETIADMLDFYYQQVSTEVEQLAKQMELTSVPEFAYQDGQWQYLAATNNTDSEDAEEETTDTSYSHAEINNAEQQFIAYLNRDSRLGGRMEKLQSLTQLNELAASQVFASKLQEAEFSSADVESYVLDTRDQVKTNNYLSLNGGKLYLGAIGLANENYNKHV